MSRTSLLTNSVHVVTQREEQLRAEGAPVTEPHDGDFPDGLSAAELGMWQAFRNGSTYDLRARDPAERHGDGDSWP